MKFVLIILKAFLINICFIGIIFAAESCPTISPKLADDNPPSQVEAILNNVICSFVNLNSKDSGTLSSTLNLTKKKIIPYVDLEYSTELALGAYWDELDARSKKIFERDLKNSLINDYISILADLRNWEDINISVDDQFTQNNNIAKVTVFISLKNQNSKAKVTLKLIQKDRWRIFDLVYQNISIIDIQKISYHSRINRKGMDVLIQKMITKT
jgi:phospholipid transport system substrate-binding protein